MSQNAQNQSTPTQTQTLTAYDLFILATSILSLCVVLIIYLPFVGNTESSIAYDLDFAFCLIFLTDFFYRLYRAPNRRYYFISSGWFDLVGSIPFIPLLRVFRAVRAIRIIQQARQMGWRTVIRQYRQNLPESAFWTTTLASILLLTTTALIIVPVELQSPDAQITNSSDAMWWSLVTTTTVGYGDMVPVTRFGRLLAGLLMTIGVAFISILTSFFTTKFYLASDIVGAQETEDFAVVDAKLEQIDRRLERIEKLLET